MGPHAYLHPPHRNRGRECRPSRFVSRFVSRVVSIRVSITMLHLEIYTGSVIPRAVTKGGKMGKLDGKDVPFMRLKSLVNPTEYVNRWSSRFPTMPAVEKK